MKHNKIFTTTTLILTLVLTGCSAAQQTSSMMETGSLTQDSVDTTKPTIEFKASTVTVVLGNDYKVSDNIKSVNDDVDGTLKETEKAVKDAGYYIVDDSKVDLKKAGEYEVTVKASDKAGNTTKKSFKLTVKEETKDSDSKMTDTKEDSSKKSDSSTKNDSSKSSSKSSSNKNSTSTKKSTSKADTPKKSSTSTGSGTSNKSTSSASTSNSSTNSSGSASASHEVAGTDTSPDTSGCNHNWVYFPDEYVTKTKVVSGGYSYQQEITQSAYLCNTHKINFFTWEEYEAHANATSCGGWQVVEVGTGQYETITVPDVTETYQEQTQWAHYECSICGDWKK